MKCIAIIFGLVLYLSTGAAFAAKDHVELGIYADYLRFAPEKSTNNFIGLGGRLGVNLRQNLAIEAELNYDFDVNLTTVFNSPSVNSFETASTRPITGLLGPKLQLGAVGPLRFFVTGKAGFIDFSTYNFNKVSATTVFNTVKDLQGSGTPYLALYPGGGVEAYLGHVGLRLESGDEIYLKSGAHNNLRIMFGPEIRF